jgi:truncated hemoglobin YjbI
VRVTTFYDEIGCYPTIEKIVATFYAGVADELLDHPAVSADHASRQGEVVGEELADLFRVTSLAERREADEVHEE